jgi:site-specific recombinase XerC
LIRVSELVGLNAEDVNLCEGVLRVMGERHRRRL